MLQSPNLLLVFPLGEHIGCKDTQVSSEGERQNKGCYPQVVGICA